MKSCSAVKIYLVRISSVFEKLYCSMDCKTSSLNWTLGPKLCPVMLLGTLSNMMRRPTSKLVSLYKSNRVCERALLGAQQGVYPVNTESGKEEPHHKCPKYVCYFSSVYLLQEEWCKSLFRKIQFQGNSLGS